MKKTLELIGCCLGWFAVIGQFILMIQHRQADVLETVVRFFSFFTILTNTLVALFFTVSFLKERPRLLQWLNRDGAITALTTFILIVGLVYQVVLRSIWEPRGFQLIVDELLHSAIPLYMLIYWILYVNTTGLQLRRLALWIIYPVIYIVFIIVRGNYSGFYPYPFLNVNEIGFESTLVNISIILGLMLVLIFALSILGKYVVKFREGISRKR